MLIIVGSISSTYTKPSGKLLYIWLCNYFYYMNEFYWLDDMYDRVDDDLVDDSIYDDCIDNKNTRLIIIFFIRIYVFII